MNNIYYGNRNESQEMTLIQDFVSYLSLGFRAFSKHPSRFLLTLAYFLVVLALPTALPLMLGLGPLGAKFLGLVYWVVGVPIFVLLYLALVAFSAVPRSARRITNACRRVGLTNRLREAPFVELNDKGVIVLKTRGVPLSEYEDRKENLESALNVRIIYLEEGVDKEHVVIHTAPGNAKLPTRIPLDLDRLPPGDTVLAVAESLDGPVTVDLSATPHLCVGGASGSGKSQMVLSLIAQALHRHMEVHLLDMKGGIDFPQSWKNGLCHFFDSRESILADLEGLENEMYRRKDLFKQLEADTGKSCSKLKTYNRLNPQNVLPTILIVCDELGQITDSTGVDKTTKALIDATIAKLSSLARLGRAFGLSLVMATQRPDSNVLPGQIKNNADVRICFRADTVLSTIILDNGDAAMLPKNIPGRCLCNLTGNTVLQGYLLSDAE